jgi:protocatechuate 4,5-dioxygenase beta chain
MYAKTHEEWDELWSMLSLRANIPQPASVARETGEQLDQMIARIQAGSAALKTAFDEYDPDILIIVGGDQSEVFDRSNVPQMMMYLGETAEGRRPGMRFRNGEIVGEPSMMTLDVDVDFSRWLLNKLVKEEAFDVAFSSRLENFGRGHGLPHAFVNPTASLLENNNKPTVLLYQNTYDPPSLSAKRCYELGQAIARVCRNDPRKIAILGSGGLAHHPRGKRSGWLDQPLDRWFLRQIAEGNGVATKSMFTFDSDTMVGGTGEIRAWITVAGAMETMGSRATVVDYVEAAKSVTGLGFAYWTTQTPELAVA